MVNTASSNQSSDSIEIAIKAKDEASDIIKNTQLAFANLKNESSILSKALTVSGDSLNAVSRAAVVAGDKIRQAGVFFQSFGAIATSGFGFVGNAIRDIIGTVDAIFSILNNPVATTFFSTVGSQAEEALSEIAPLSDGLKQIATVVGKFGSSFAQALTGLNLQQSGQQVGNSFLTGLSVGFQRISPILDIVDVQIRQIFGGLSSVAGRASQALNLIGLFPGQVAGIDEQLEIFGYVEQIFGGISEGVNAVSQKIFFFTQALGSLQQLTQNGPFQLLIGQTVELREQLLATQASLVGTSKILNSFTGKEIADPVEAIQSLDLPIKNQIELLRKESLELVGVTSKELVPLYQQVAQRITSIGGSLSDARALSLDFAASLGTLNIPLFQSQQEISSILSGTIDHNSALATNLNISNDQVNNWKAQGKLVEELSKRLEAFRQGNKLASQTFGGLTSNIQEIFDEIGRAAGERLIDPLVNQLGEVYKFLEANQQQLIAYFQQFSQYFLRIGSAIAQIIQKLGVAFKDVAAKLPILLFESLANIVESFAQVLSGLIQFLSPIVSTLSAMLELSGRLGGPLLQIFLTTTALSSALGVLNNVFTVFAKTIPGLGELMYIIDVRSSGLINQFVNLSNVVGLGASGFLLLGKNLESIPGAMGIIQQSLGPAGVILAQYIPTLAGIGIQLSGLVVLFPALGAFFSNLITLTPGVLATASAFFRTNIFLAPLAPLLDDTANAVSLYANASTRASVIGTQFAGVIKSVAQSLAANVISLGLLASSVYAAFVIFDNLILKNETVREVIKAVGEVFSDLGEVVASVFGNPFTAAIAASALLGTTIYVALIPPVRTLLKLQLGTWATLAANALNGLSKAVGLLGLTNFASALLGSSIGLKTIGVLFTSGTAAAVRFAAKNGLVIKTFSFLPPALAKGTAGLAVFQAALARTLATLAPIALTVAAAAAAIAAFGLILRSQQLADSSEAVEIYRQQLEATGNQSIKLAQKLKKAGDIQKEANEKGVRLSDEQYKANQRLLNQSKNQIILLQEQLKARQAALAETKGDGNKAALEQQIKDLERQIALLQNLSGDAIQIAPKDLKDKGSAFEQLEKKIQGAKDALASPSGDEEVFKNKANELIDFTQKQLELGNITAEEARRNLALVANNTKVDQETRTKAQQAITESFKKQSAERVDILKAEFDLINAQLAAGQLDFAKNAEEIANLQNSVLEERQQEEQKAHQATLKRIEEEYQARKFVLEQEAITLRNKAKEKPGTQESKDAIARAEQINKELVELEQKKNQDLTNQTKNNAATNQAIAKQITQNKATQAKLGAELEKQVRSGAISEEEAALRQSSAVKKAELDTQLASTKAAYENSRAAIALQFQQDIDKLDKELQEAQSKADKLPENTKEFQQAQNEIVSLQTKYAGLRDARETALGKADREFEAESKKLNAQALQNQADTQKKQRDAAIKFLDSRQKEAQDILQKSQNAQLINLQKLENEGINIRAESEFEKTKLSRDQINEQLRQEQERLKKLQSLPKPENQEEQIQLDAQIRASRLKTQELIRQGLENEAKAYESQIQAVRDRIQIENTLSETNLQRQYLKGKALRSRIEVESAESKVRELETALTLEIKNIEKRAALEAELEQARTGLADARVAATRDRIQVENTIIETGLQRQYRTGQILRSKAEIETARGKVREIQAALKIETRRTKERVALEAELEQALTALLDAEIRERQELIDTQNQEYLNQIEEQNQAIKQQSVLYEVLASALEIRNKLLEATKNLTQAAAGFVVSELDALSKLESSEYRRKQIAEITAAVKLEALRKQQEFERESLEIQIQQNKLALEREAIQNRINQAAKIGEIAKEVAEIESLKADPRNNNRAGQAQIRARELAVQAKQFELVQLGVQGELIGSQLNNQETLANFQRRSQELSQKGQERQAQVELINSLPAGRRQRAQRASRQRILEESFGFSDSREFRNAGLSLSRDIVQRETGIVPTVDVLSGIDPELGGLLENLSGAQGQSAIADVRKTFDSKFGGTASFSGIESADPTGKPLQLLPEFQGRLTLPSPGDRGVVLGLEKTGSLFNMGVDKLIKFLDGKDGVKGGTINYNINVSAPTGTAKASGNGTTPSLENVLRLAKQTAGIR